MVNVLYSFPLHKYTVLLYITLWILSSANCVGIPGAVSSFGKGNFHRQPFFM